MNDLPKEPDTSDHVALERKAIQLIKQGKINKAEQIYQQLISDCHSSHVVFSNLGAICLLKGRYCDSEFYAAAALELKPDFPKAHHCLGNALRKQGKFSASIDAYYRALKLNPSFTQVYNSLGSAFKAKGQIADAIDSYKKALKLEPRFLQACHNLGIALKENGQLDEAIKYYQKAISFKPNFPQAHNNLGVALKDSGRLQEAIDSYKKAVELEPNFYQAFNNLGVAFKEKGLILAATKSYKKALEINPNYITAYNNLGIAYKDNGDLESALFCHTRVLNIDPSNPNAFYRLGRIQRSKGELKLAKQSLRKALEFNPKHSDALHILSTDIENEYEAKDLIQASENAKKNKLTIRERAMIEFCLANCFHKLKAYSTAAAHVAEANKLKLSYMPSNLKYRLNQADQLMSASESMEKGCHTDGLGRIFIVGVPRCGSTLLETILATNSNIIELGETDALSKAIKQINGDESEKMSISLAEAYTSQLPEESKRAHFTVDKNLYNYQRVGHIVRGMPAAKIIHCRRNPLDNILSMLRSNLRSGNNFTSDPIDAAKFILSHEELINRNKVLYSDQIYTFNYDEFANSPEATIKPLIHWLNLDWSVDYLYPEKNTRIVNTASAIQVRRPINNKSVEGWKNYRDLLQPAEDFLKENESKHFSD